MEMGGRGEGKCWLGIELAPRFEKGVGRREFLERAFKEREIQLVPHEVS